MSVTYARIIYMTTEISQIISQAKRRMIYTDAYGWVPRFILSLYRKHNVSPADHDMLTMTCHTWAGVQQTVIENLHDGNFYYPIQF